MRLYTGMDSVSMLMCESELLKFLRNCSGLEHE